MADATIKVIEASTGGTDLGGIQFSQSGTTVKVGKQTVVDQTGAEVPFAKDATVSAVTTSLGTDGTSPPSIAGTGVRGWLRAIYERLLATLTVSGTVSVGNFPATQPVSGSVTVTQATAGNLNATVTGSVSLGSGANSIGNIGTVATITNPVTVTGSATVSGTVTANQGTAGASPWPVSDGGGSLTVDGTVSVGNFPANQGVNLASGPGTAASTPAFMVRVADDLCINSTGAAAAAVTLTIPAVAGQFHYIDAIEITLYSTAARTGAATPVTVTSTNLPGAPTWIFESAGAIGTAVRYALSANCALKSSVVNTATTIVCPAVTGGLWNVKAIYRTAA